MIMRDVVIGFVLEHPHAAVKIFAAGLVAILLAITFASVVVQVFINRRHARRYAELIRIHSQHRRN